MCLRGSLLSRCRQAWVNWSFVQTYDCECNCAGHRRQVLSEVFIGENVDLKHK